MKAYTDIEQSKKYKELLQSKINNSSICANDLKIGRVMSFGKYKGKHVLLLLSKHPHYMQWVVDNTNFHLSDLELWWKDMVDTALLVTECDRLVYALGKQVVKEGELPETNPHYIVE